MTKSDALKVPTRRETVILKVFIHCEECQKQVKKALKKLDGVESIAIDAALGKVTVVGLVAASTLVKKLTRAGKYAALWNSPSYSMINDIAAREYHNSSAGSSSSSSSSARTKPGRFTRLGSALDQISSTSSRDTHVNHKLAGGFYEDDAAGESGGDHHDVNWSHDVNYMNSSSKPKGIMKGTGKRVSFQGDAPLMSQYAVQQGSNSAVADPYNFHSSALLTGKILTSAVERNSYHNNMDSVEYATNMFSDENAHSCSLM